MQIGAAMFFTDYSMSAAELARACEARGFESVWAPEHSHIPLARNSPFPSGGELPKQYSQVMDPFVTLSAAAAVTKTIKLGTGVCLVIQRSVFDERVMRRNGRLEVGRASEYHLDWLLRPESQRRDSVVVRRIVGGNNELPAVKHQRQCVARACKVRRYARERGGFDIKFSQAYVSHAELLG